MEGQDCHLRVPSVEGAGIVLSRQKERGRGKLYQEGFPSDSRRATGIIQDVLYGLFLVRKSVANNLQQSDHFPTKRASNRLRQFFL